MNSPRHLAALILPEVGFCSQVAASMRAGQPQVD